VALFIEFVPTPSEHIDGFFELAPVSSSDVVWDLGSGDGRLLFAALDEGAGRAVGVEMDPEHVHAAREAAKSKGLEERITFLEADVMEVNLADASVVLCYLSPAASAALKPKLELELRPGTRVVMESFPVPGWKPVRTSDRWYKQFYLYIMPPQSTDQYPRSDAGFDYLYRLALATVVTGLAFYSFITVLGLERGLKDVTYGVMVLLMCFVIWSTIAIAYYRVSTWIARSLIAIGAVWAIVFIVIWGISTDASIWTRLAVPIGSGIIGGVIGRLIRLPRRRSHRSVCWQSAKWDTFKTEHFGIIKRH
jgi:SAM-dependent methyltransferase